LFPASVYLIETYPMKPLSFFLFLFVLFAACGDPTDPKSMMETGEVSTSESEGTGETGSETTLGEPRCMGYESCLGDALEAMAACGAADGPCTDSELDGCDRMACLSSCRLEAAQGAQECDTAFPECADDGSPEACRADCYAIGLECLNELETCEDSLFGECSAAQGTCIAGCSE